MRNPFSGLSNTLLVALAVSFAACPPAVGTPVDGGAGGGGGSSTVDSGVAAPDSGLGAADGGASLDAGMGSSDAGALELVVVTTLLPRGDQAIAYSTTVQATGGTPPYLWAISSGLLPTGLTLAADGTISGSPASSGVFHIVATVTDSAATSAAAMGALTLVIYPPLAIKTTPPPGAGAVNVPYSATFMATGGTAPYTFSAKPSTLPKGLSLTAAGVLSGTPTLAGRSVFVVTVTDSAARTATARFVVLINGAGTLLVSTANLPGGARDAAYTASLTAFGGTTPYSWTVTAGALPAGVSLATDGTLSGTPTASGLAAFTVQVKDASLPKKSDTADLTIDIQAPLVITTTMLPPGAQAASYTTSLASSGGLGQPTWALTSGSLPAGLTLSSQGVISGTPSQVGTFAFVVTATDTSEPPQVASASLTVSIAPVLAISTKTLPNGTKGVAYSKALGATGGTKPYVWAVASGSVPAGLSLSLAGVLSGTPTTIGSSTFKIAVSDASSPVQLSTSDDLTIFIGGAGALAITTAALPTGVSTQPYASTLAATGGTGPYTWSIASGALPPGLKLSSAGDLSGAPSGPGTSSFTVRASDQSLPTQLATAPLTLTVYDPLVIATTMLATGVVGSAYAATLLATGGLAPVSWSLSAGSLPAGVSLSSSGSLTGTPTESGTFTFTVTATDASADSLTATAMLRLTTLPALVITTSDLPDGLVASAYSATVNATGGLKPYTWALTGGALPAGLMLSASGTISGTPTASGNALVQLTVTDAGGQSKTVTYSFFINGAGTLTITSGPPPAVLAGTPYSATATVAGGTPPYTWSISSGALPAGLALSSTGVISGTTSNAGTFAFTLAVIDSTMPTPVLATQSTQLVVVSKLAVKSSSLADAVVNSPYSASLKGIGGTPPYTWSISAGSLPAGVTLDAATGVISGAATTAGTSSFTVKATDSGAPSQQATKDLSITVTTAIAIATTSPLPATVVGANYLLTFAATGGSPPYTWAAVGGGSVPGLTVTGTGVASGTPTTAGTYTFSMRVEDASTPKQSQTRSCRLTVASALAISSDPLPNGVANVAYAATVSATGGNQPYTWSVSAGMLPAGVTLDAATGALTGTPTTAGTKSFSLTVTDATQPAVTATKAYSVVIAPVGTLTVTTFTVPSGVIGVAYPAASLTASGGSGGYVWSVSAGALPTGVSLSAAGALSGTPTEGGTAQFTVKVTDSASATATRAMSTLVNAALVITAPNPLPTAVVDQPYAMILTSTGGTGQVSWSSGPLPSGLSVSALGVITGTPSGAKGRLMVTFTATDSAMPPQTTSATLALNVDTKLSISTASLPGGTVGTAYPQTPLMASGGTLPYLWAIQGTMPPGLTLSVNGVIKGTPTTAGDYTLIITVVDSYGQIALKPLGLAIQ